MKKTNNIIKDSLNPRILDPQAPFAIREAFNLLRTNLMYTIADNDSGAPVFAVTSPNEAAGKSTVITNLAISFAQLDQKVLLIDADLRCPVLHDYFGFDSKHQGLSELISGISKDVIVKDVRPNLDLITSGRIPPNPSELITSPRFASCLDKWKKEYDIIFVDFPPIGIVSDSVANCKSISGYIFTVRSGRSTAKSINNSIETMEKLGAKILGVVLNDYNLKGSGYYKRRSARYKYYSKSRSKYEQFAERNSAEKANSSDK